MEMRVVGAIVVIIGVGWNLFTSTGFDFQNCVGEAGYFSFTDVWEGIFFAGIVNVPAMPVVGISTGSVFIESIFSNQSDIMIQIDANRVVAGNLERSSSIRYTQNYISIKTLKGDYYLARDPVLESYSESL
jgi:hypothetical protein